MILEAHVFSDLDTLYPGGMRRIVLRVVDFIVHAGPPFGSEE